MLWLSAGVLGPRTYGALVLMAVLTTIITPVFLRFAFDSRRPEGAEWNNSAGESSEWERQTV